MPQYDRTSLLITSIGPAGFAAHVSGPYATELLNRKDELVEDIKLEFYEG